MSDSITTATPETKNAAPMAHPPVRENQIEAEVDRSQVAGQRVMRSIGGGSPVAPPDRFAGALGQMQSASGQAGMLRQLQRSYGNSYVGNVIQAKLTVNQPGDIYEQEADRMAAQVMATPQSGSIQREMEPKKEKEKIQMKPSLQLASDGNREAGGNLEGRLNGSKGGGSPLPDDVRSFMEPRFGADFSQVRVHTGSESVQMNQDLNAQAFTHRQDVYFGAGKAPAKDALTAHELTHVVQQTGGVQTKQDYKQPTIQLKCSACENKEVEEAIVQRSSNILVNSEQGIQRWPLFGNDEDKTKSDSNSNGGILDWAKEKVGGAIDSATQSVSDTVDWAKEKGDAALGTLTQAGNSAGSNLGAEITSISPTVLGVTKRLARIFNCKPSIGRDGITISCGRIKLTDPYEEKIWEFPKLSKIKNLKDFVIPGVKIESPQLGLDIGPSLFFSVGSITLNNIFIQIDPRNDKYLGEGQINIPIGTHIVFEVAGKISSGVTASIPLVEGISIPIKGFAEGGFRGEGIGSSIANIQNMVRLAYVQNEFSVDYTNTLKAGFKVQVNVTPFLNVQYSIAGKDKVLCEFTSPIWTWEKLIKAEELSIPISIRPGERDRPIIVGPITQQPISGDEIEGELSRNLPGIHGECTKLDICQLVNEAEDFAQTIAGSNALDQGLDAIQLGGAIDNYCRAGTRKTPFEIIWPKPPSKAYPDLFFGGTIDEPRKQSKMKEAFEKGQQVGGLPVEKFSSHKEKELPETGEDIGLAEEFRAELFAIFGPLQPPGVQTPKGGKILKVLKPYGFSATLEEREGDHVHEFQLGGPDVIENLWPLDKGLNNESNVLNAPVKYPQSKREITVRELKKRVAGNDKLKYFFMIVGFK